MTQEELKKIWNLNGKVSLKLATFGFRCAIEPKWNQIMYLAQIVEPLSRQPDTTGRMFRDLQSLNLATGYLSWPLVSLSSKGEVAAVRMVVPDLKVWDFHTGKRLRSL